MPYFVEQTDFGFALLASLLCLPLADNCRMCFCANERASHPNRARVESFGEPFTTSSLSNYHDSSLFRAQLM